MKNNVNDTNGETEMTLNSTGKHFHSLIFAAACTLFAICAASSSPANAQTTSAAAAGMPKFELSLSYGPAKQTGYLTTDDSAGGFVVGVNALRDGALFSFQFSGFSVSHDTSEFGLANGSKTRVSTFTLLPLINVFERPRAQVAIGIAPMLVSVYQTSPDNQVTYGTFMLAGLFRYELSDRWAAQWNSQWFNVEQTTNGQTTSFEVWQNAFGLAYSWN